ncbi:MAG: hypothetical protein K1X75_08595 [Leptospirales bacterium]|nr:hypothetical protein [Leptospirales bacterium]
MSDTARSADLFSEFTALSREQWEDRIRKDLKGADFDRKMIWQSEEGFAVRPFYTRADLLAMPESYPGMPPYLRGYRAGGNAWELRQDIVAENAGRANALALAALQHGAEAVSFVGRTRFLNGRLSGSGALAASAAELGALLDGIWIDRCGIEIVAGEFSAPAFDWLLAEFEKRKLSPRNPGLRLACDPASDLLTSGVSALPWPQALKQCADLMRRSHELGLGWRTLRLSSDAAGGAGANLSQQTAIVLAAGHELLLAALDGGLSAEQFAGAAYFHLGVSSQYFPEIARLRALRALWSRIVGEYAGENAAAGRLFVSAASTLSNKTIYDRHNNLLRSNVEAMAALIGGCDSFSAMPFDLALGKSDEFSQRLAINTQLLLRHETHLDKTIDPAAGSYYLESLSEMIAANAWLLFQQIEAQGGFFAAAQSGWIAAECAKSAAQTEKAIATRRRSLIGVNQYPNREEQVLELLHPTAERLLDSENRSLVCAPLKEYRPGASFEELRMQTERAAASGRRAPAVFPLLFGDRALRTARASFCANFFGCAGFTVLDQPAAESAEAAAEAARQSGAEIIVLCAGDEDYAAEGVAILQLLLQKVPAALRVIAGNPESAIEALKAAGAQRFVHLRTPLLSELSEYQRILGISA